jgi:3-methyladenine DNA glycosylase AlkD
MHGYVRTLVDSLKAQADPDQAGPMAKYLRDQFPFLGIKTPERRALLKGFVSEHGLPPMAELAEIVRQLWELPEREYHYSAVYLLGRRQRQLTPGYIPLIEHLIVTNSWWDTVDGLATNSVGSLLARYPDIRDGTIGRWRVSDNFWLRRVTLLFQLKYKDRTDEALLYDLIQENLDSKEFFIQKAIGWALREYSKTAAGSVQTFVFATQDLPALSRREGLKWLKNKGLLAE